MSVFTHFMPLVDFVFPPRCPICGEGITQQGGLCAPCWSKLVIPGQPACDSCGRPFSGPVSVGATCSPCLEFPPEHDGIIAASVYNETSRKLVLTLKYGGRIALGVMMARLIASRLDLDGDDWLVIPVPLHRWRLWKRGFNQAAILGRELSRLKGYTLCVDGLKRVRATTSLGGLGASERLNVLSDSIAINHRSISKISGSRIILVDDVHTSGATSQQCVQALKNAGAARVVVACFARVLDEAFDHL